MKNFRLIPFILLFTSIASFNLYATEARIDFKIVTDDIKKLMHQHHYNPTELSSNAYKNIEKKMEELASTATDKQDFINDFNRIWYEGPFSHVRIDNASMSSSQMVEYLDTMNVGGNGVSLTWRDTTAILTVNTMMGMDTIEQIFAAYREIDQKKANGLIIDLRTNNGGAFAVKPLVSHLIQAPLDAGIFISQPWNKAHERLPNRKEISQQVPWSGWSIKSFWSDTQNNAITRIQFQPTAPYFNKPVYVLTSKQTASAAELATDALSYIDNVTVVGEVTAGQMLSQKMYDISHGLQLALPIADYYATNSGRIEQQGVKPDISMPANKAMEYALQQLQTKH